MRIDRRSLILGASTLTLGAGALGLAGCGGGGGAVTSDDMSLGKADAPVTVIEYASLACSHCGQWNREVFPAFKAKYIDTGKVHYVFREFATPPQELAAAGALLARCAGKDRYFTVIDAVFHGQEEIFTTGDMRGVLQRIAQSAGMNEEQFIACVSDEKALKAFNARWEKYAREDKIEATPTFLFNGDRYDKGEMSMAEIDAAYAKALAKKK
ncbi:MAG: thioredoxin domain-containing protein [Caulobacter sp.]|nr:thioredoxin domain-containing protein [Caulobacter sp.]